MGRVVKRSNAVQITVCGRYLFTGSGNLGMGWDRGCLSPAATLSRLKADQTGAGEELGRKRE